MERFESGLLLGNPGITTYLTFEIGRVEQASVWAPCLDFAGAPSFAGFANGGDLDFRFPVSILRNAFVLPRQAVRCAQILFSVLSR
jgi:hypothetical protein